MFHLKMAGRRAAQLLAAGLLVLGLTVSAMPARAVGSYNNAALADYALTFVGQNLGSVNGQCRMFVNNVVRHVSGGTQNVSSTNGGYFGAFLNAGGQEITSFNSLVKGDIVQKYVSETDLHTWIIVSRDADGLYWVVDSNSQNNTTVRHYKRTAFTGLSSTTRAFRMGTVASAPPIGSPARSDVDQNGGADLFLTRSVSGGTGGYALLSTYQSFLTPQQWWNGAGFGWGGVTPLVGDVNGDKKADYVFLTNEGANGTKAFVATSTGGGFNAPQLWWNGSGWGYGGIKAALGDVDNNGGEDLVVTTSEPNGSAAYVLRSTYGTFLAPQLWWNGTAWGWSGITPMVSDVDGNKKADYVLLANEGANGTRAFVAVSNGSTFAAPQLWWDGTGWGYSGIKPAMGDIDGNGGADLVLTTSQPTGTAMYVLRSTYGTFLAPTLGWDGVGFGWGGVTPLAGDVNGDKLADYVFLTDEGANGTKAFVATSNGSTFNSPQLWWNGSGWGYSGLKAYLK